jgi:hypothetical protein
MGMARGRRYASAGIPGTGLSVRQYSPAARIGGGLSTPRPAFSHGLWIAGLVLAVLLAIAAATRP